MNKAILLGRLTKDPELRYTNVNNTAVASFTLAVNRRYVSQGEERQADFINCVAWGKNGEFVNNYYKKGQQVSIIGRIQTRSWNDDKGGKHYVTEVIVEECYFADTKQNKSTNQNNNQGSGTNQQQSFSSSNNFELVDDDEDDLPF